eukprot:495217-Ditylum_brightwellii.AAC.1
MEEMLITCMYPVMKTYWLKGGTIGYKGNVLNIGQDISGLVSSLPQRIDHILIMIVQKQNKNVTARYKILQSPMLNYTTVAYLSSSKQPTLPEDGSVKGEINAVEEEELGQDAHNISTAAREINVSPIQATLGPEQGGASG